MSNRTLTVRSKLALAFVTACALTFGVGGSFISRTVLDSLEKEILTRLEFQSQAYARALELQLSMLARRTEDFASDGFVRDGAERLLAAGLSGETEARESLLLRDSLGSHLLNSQLSLVPAFLDLEVISMEGEALFSAHSESPDSAFHWLNDGLDRDQLSVSPLFAAGSTEGLARFALAAPLVSREGGQRLGWLVSWVHPSAWIFGALEGAGLGVGAGSVHQEKARIHLLDGRGARLTLLPDRFEEGLPGESAAWLRDGFGLTFHPAETGAPAKLLSYPGDGILQRHFALGETTWQLVVECNTAQALSAVAGLQGHTFGVGILVAAAACLLFLLPMRVLTRPLLQLAEAAKRVGEGQDPILPAMDSRDEIGVLGRSFISMAQAVKERTRLQERAAEDLRQRQGELQAERDRLKAVIGSMRGGLIVLDPDGRPVVFNQAAEPVLRALQNKTIEIESRHLCERGSADSNACYTCLFEPQGKPKSCQVEIDQRTFEIHASQLPPDQEGRVGRVLVCHDFTDRVNLDERMIHQERLAVLGEVAAVMAHELNNPLAAISMYNQMLARELEGNPSALEDVEVIQRNVESCKRAIRELLDYATGATPEVDSIDIGAVLEDVAAFTRPLCDRAEVELVITISDEPILAWGDELQVRQIFVNLLVNAIQALGAKGGRVSMQAGIEGHHVSVRIIDNGPGIPAEAQAKIFRPFFTTKGRGKGTGLGLPTARRIAEMHGGGLDLVRTDHRGSEFRVRLMQQEAALL